VYQDSDELLQLLMHAVKRIIGEKRLIFYGHIVAYDPANHAVRAQIPSLAIDESTPAIETGWMPLGSPMVGNGYGIQAAPEWDPSGLNGGSPTGTPCEIILNEQDGAAMVAGVRFADKHRAPFAQMVPGELGIKSKAGTSSYFDKDGNLTHVVVGDNAEFSVTQKPTGAKLILHKDGSIEITTGEVGGPQAPLKLNGTADWVTMAAKIVKAFNDHTHQNVQSGSSNSGTPTTPWVPPDPKNGGGTVGSTKVNVGE